MSERGYQYGFSHGNPAMHSIEGRRRKAATVLAVLQDSLGERLLRARVLNVGCSTGIVDVFLAPHVGTVIGIDIDAPAVEAANANCDVSNAEFRVGDAMQLEFPDASFDVVICSQVYEHVPDPSRMMAEIRRVLAPDGVCYFGATNRLCIMEKHYQLPMLSVIPVSWAHRYLRLLGRGRFYHERHLALGGLRRLTAGFRIKDYTRRLVEEPDRFGTTYMVGNGWKRVMASFLVRHAYAIVPGYVWVLAREGRVPDAVAPRDPEGNGLLP